MTPVLSGLKVLAEHGGQQLDGLSHRVRQLPPLDHGQYRVAVPGAGVDQHLPGRGVVPVDDRLAGADVVITTGQQRP